MRTIRLDKITNNHGYCLKRRRLSSSCYLSSAPVKAARGESPPTCTLFSNIGKRFMDSTKYLVALHILPHSFLPVWMFCCECSFARISRCSLKYFPYSLFWFPRAWPDPRHQNTDVKHNSDGGLRSDPCPNGVFWISGSYLPLIGALLLGCQTSDNGLSLGILSGSDANERSTSCWLFFWPAAPAVGPWLCTQKSRMSQHDSDLYTVMKKNPKKHHCWYYIINQGYFYIFIRLLPLVSASHNVRVLHSNKLGAKINIIFKWIQQKKRKPRPGHWVETWAGFYFEMGGAEGKHPGVFQSNTHLKYVVWITQTHSSAFVCRSGSVCYPQLQTSGSWSCFAP